ncbi:aminomethyltransferase family protein [Streptomyces viridochromogenes]|uniref:Putative Glycine cleavage T protein (Aminomethyl transferase) n=1 Tax=Streptomyces viridochromogenes Tue57 TaxID=1160705 RepID=L8P457_STRVR|nr:putative Glycine cleavage T protein (Aminomethyl transferase) [Streptomyces viridochromogenes Tue57]
MTPLKRLEVTGPEALAFLHLTIARPETERFQTGANGNLDLDWLRRRLPTDGSVQVRDITAGTCCLGIWGPRARDLVQPLTDTDFSHQGFGYFKAKQAYLGDVPVTAMRLSYAGEPGWEIYTTAGRSAFNSLRLEKGYRSWGHDMTAEHNPYEAGLGFAVRRAKEHFTGKAALEGINDETVTRRLTPLVQEEQSVVTGHEPVYADGRPVGHVTSTAYGYTIGAPIAYAWLSAEHAAPGTPEIEYFGAEVPALTAAEPLFDPEMSRIRR